jgi:hypothetical protein
MVRRLGMMMAAVGVVLAGSPARAFTLGEVTATTGVHQTLAKSGTRSAASTIGSVKGALNQAVATKNGQLNGSAPAPVGWGGKPGTGGWVTAGGAAGGWATGGASGWAVASAGSWAPGGASGAWASGSWNGAR